MNDADTYYKTLAERGSGRQTRDTADTVDRAIAAIGEPLSPPSVDHV